MPMPFNAIQIKPIKSESDYDWALTRLNDIFDAPADSPEGDEAEVLTVLIEKYEEQHHPIGLPDPIAAIRIRMKELGLQQKDLADAFGGANRVSEVLNGKRSLTVNMIRELHTLLQLPYEVLLQDS